jgi:hypothetical protein
MTCSPLVFTTGGDANWAPDRGGYYGNDSGRSPDLEQDQESWLQTTVEGPGWIDFYWAVSSDGGDCLQFYIDEELQHEIGGVSGFGNRWESGDIILFSRWYLTRGRDSGGNPGTPYYFPEVVLDAGACLGGIRGNPGTSYYLRGGT